MLPNLYKVYMKKEKLNPDGIGLQALLLATPYNTWLLCHKWNITLIGAGHQ
jgi:hypothetical protein